MKIFVLNSDENWFCDRYAQEWDLHNPDISTNSPYESNLIWLLASWRWREISMELLEKKKVIATIHHVVPSKFKEQEFAAMDQIVDAYHVPCKKTKQFIQNFTGKPIHIVGYWGNPRIWFPIDKKECRDLLGLPVDKYLVGSFQRDTEGYDLKTPKLEKGPDIFCDIVEDMHSKNKNLEVVLAGWRRQYVMNRLRNSDIKYHYFEMPSFETVNKLYNSIDLYVVGSRFEGGPQALLECAMTKTSIISTNVGMAEDILDNESILDINIRRAVPNVDVAYDKVQKYLIPNWFDSYKAIFKEVLNG